MEREYGNIIGSKITKDVIHRIHPWRNIFVGEKDEGRGFLELVGLRAPYFPYRDVKVGQAVAISGRI